MRINKLLASLLLMVSSLAAAQGREVATCYQLLEERKPSEALAEAQKALDADKNNREALICKGRTHAELKQYNESLSALQAAAQLSSQTPDRVIALLLVGNVQKAAGQQAEAFASYKQALDFARDKQDKTMQRLALNVLGDSHFETGQVQQALDYYLPAAELAANEGERGEDYARLARAYGQLGNYDQSIEYQVKAVLMLGRVGERDDYANAGLELGRMYMDAKNYQQAENAINKILKFARENGSAYWEARANYYLGLSKAGQGQTEAARTVMLDAHHNARRIGAATLASEIGEAMLKLPQK